MKQKCELFYQSGGHGGPYESEEIAAHRAKELLIGMPSETAIEVRLASDQKTVLQKITRKDVEKELVLQKRCGPYSSHSGRSLGRILYFLYMYSGLHVAERATCGDGVVYHPGTTVFAEYRWLADKDIPVFTFYGDLKEVTYLHKRQMEMLEVPF